MHTKSRNNASNCHPNSAWETGCIKQKKHRKKWRFGEEEKSSKKYSSQENKEEKVKKKKRSKGPELKKKKCDRISFSVKGGRSFKGKGKQRQRETTESRAPRNRALKVEQDPHLPSQKRKKKTQKTKKTPKQKTEH